MKIFYFLEFDTDTQRSLLIDVALARRGDGELIVSRGWRFFGNRCYLYSRENTSFLDPVAEFYEKFLGKEMHFYLGGTGYNDKYAAIRVEGKSGDEKEILSFRSSNREVPKVIIAAAPPFDDYCENTFINTWDMGRNPYRPARLRKILADNNGWWEYID